MHRCENVGAIADWLVTISIEVAEVGRMVDNPAIVGGRSQGELTGWRLS